MQRTQGAWAAVVGYNMGCRMNTKRPDTRLKGSYQGVWTELLWVGPHDQMATSTMKIFERCVMVGWAL